MRKQDLRKFDINLMTWIMVIFCTGSGIFILFWMTDFIFVHDHDLTFMLWLSYSIFFIIALVVYLATKQPTVVWVRPEPEGALETESRFPFTSGQSYLVKAEGSAEAREAFKDAVSHGKRGMFVTRTNPMIIKKDYNLMNTFLLWLTEVDTRNAINPIDIEELSYTLKKFLKNTPNPVILLEGLEYLINVLSFNKVLNFIQDLRDEAALDSGNIIVPLNPELFKPQERRLIEKEFMEMNPCTS